MFSEFEAPPSLPETVKARKYRMAAVGPYSSNTQFADIVERLLGSCRRGKGGCGAYTGPPQKKLLDKQLLFYKVLSRAAQSCVGLERDLFAIRETKNEVVIT